MGSRRIHGLERITRPCLLIALAVLSSAAHAADDNVIGTYAERLAHIELALKDMKATFGGRCPDVHRHLAELEAFKPQAKAHENALREMAKRHYQERRDIDQKWRKKDTDARAKDKDYWNKNRRRWNAEKETELAALAKQQAAERAASPNGKLMAFQQKALLDNPLLDIDIVLVRRTYGAKAHHYRANNPLPVFNSYAVNIIRPREHPVRS